MEPEAYQSGIHLILSEVSSFKYYKLSKELFTFSNVGVDFITLFPIYKKNEITQKLNLCSYREHQRYF